MGPDVLANPSRPAHGRLGSVNAIDPLGYGTHLILDGFRADASRLADGALLESVLQELCALLNEGEVAATVRVPAPAADEAGLSVALVAGESQLSMHAFPALKKLSLDVFSGRSMATEAITRVFVERFRVGRYECRVHGRVRLLPKDRAGLEHVLPGERDYARLRLRDLLRR